MFDARSIPIRRDRLPILLVCLVYTFAFFYKHDFPFYGADHPGHVWASTRLTVARDVFEIGISNPLAQLFQFTHGFFTISYPYVVYEVLDLFSTPFREVVWDFPVYLTALVCLFATYAFVRARGYGPGSGALAAAIVGCSPAFVGLSRVLVGNQIFSLMWLSIVFFLLERSRTSRETPLLVYMATALYVGSSNVFFLGVFVWFPAYQMIRSYEAAADGERSNWSKPALLGAAKQGASKWFTSRGFALPLLTIAGYVSFTLVYLQFYGDTEYASYGFLLRLFAKTGGSDALVNPAAVVDIGIHVLGVGLVGLLVLFLVESVRYRTEMRDGVQLRIGLFSVMVVTYCLIGLKADTSFYYAVVGVLPFALAFTELTTVVPTRRLLTVGVVCVLITSSVSGVLLFGVGLTGGPDRGSMFGAVKPDDGSRATGLYIRNWQDQGVVPVQPAVGYNESLLAFSTKEGDFFYSGIDYREVDNRETTSAEFEDVKSTWQAVRNATGENHDVVWNETDSSWEAVRTDDADGVDDFVVLTVYRTELGSDFNRTVDYLRSQERLDDSVVVTRDGEVIAAVFTNHIEETHRVEVDEANERYFRTYDRLDQYGHLGLGAY